MSQVPASCLEDVCIDCLCLAEIFLIFVIESGQRAGLGDVCGQIFLSHQSIPK